MNRGMIVGESSLIKKCLDDVARASNNDLPVLITGETGTGKELFAQAIHKNSRRASAEFIVIDCAALAENLVEGMLFGHVKGAFTGAVSDKTGLLTLAHKGTLFLDEVGELPLNIQRKFLRALQEKKFRPVGAQCEVESDFRLVCATHRDLKSMVQEKLFREDLFFRIFSMSIHLPPLRDRKNDIQAIVENHMALRTERLNTNQYTLSEEFVEDIHVYQWPGNVRELLNTFDLICSEASPGSILFPHHLPGHIRAAVIRKKMNKSTHFEMPQTSPMSSEQKNIHSLTYKAYVEKMKYAYLKGLLEINKRNIPECCRRSGLSRSQLYRLMQQFDLKIM
jgi:two-component system NtrC family response regulator